MMLQNRDQVTFLMADDDPDDRLLAERALLKCRHNGRMVFVEDGEELLDYLLRRGKFADAEESPLPSVILLDLNMPRKDGRQALEEIKSHQSLRHIPVVIMTTSQADEDVCRSYDLGANAFIPKPSTFDGLVDVMSSLSRFWFDVVKLPTDAGGRAHA